MRLPKDPENWTYGHFDKAMEKALKEFDKYEAKIDFDWPKEKQEKCYEPYWQARQEALAIGAVLGPYERKKAEALP